MPRPSGAGPAQRLDFLVFSSGTEVARRSGARKAMERALTIKDEKYHRVDAG